MQNKSETSINKCRSKPSVTNGELLPKRESATRFVKLPLLSKRNWHTVNSGGIIWSFLPDDTKCCSSSKYRETSAGYIQRAYVVLKLEGNWQSSSCSGALSLVFESKIPFANKPFYVTNIFPSLQLRHTYQLGNLNSVRVRNVFKIRRNWAQVNRTKLVICW